MATKPVKSKELPDVVFAALPISEKMLLEVCPALERDMAELQDQLKHVEISADAPTVARAFVALHRVREIINSIIGEERSAFSGAWVHYKTEAVRESLEKAGVNNLPLSEGFRVGLTNRTSASIAADKKSEAYQWLRDNDMGSLIQETVHAGTLSAAFTAMIEEHNIEPPSKLFTLHSARHASVTKIKAFK